MRGFGRSLSKNHGNSLSPLCDGTEEPMGRRLLAIALVVGLIAVGLYFLLSYAKNGVGGCPGLGCP